MVIFYLLTALFNNSTGLQELFLDFIFYVLLLFKIC